MPKDASTNFRRFALLFIIVFDAFATGIAYAQKEYFATAFGAFFVIVACTLLGERLYERAK